MHFQIAELKHDSTRRYRAALVAFTLAFPLLVARSQLLTGDPAYYVGLARALATGEGYSFMGEPHATYPPGLPMLLAPFAAFAGTDVLTMQLVVSAFGALAVMAILALVRRYEARTELTIGFLFAVSYPFFAHATQGIRAELPYVAASAWALSMLLAAPSPSRESRLLGVAALMTVAAVLIRTIGTALPAACVAAWLHRRVRGQQQDGTDRALLVSGVTGMMAAALWFAWTAHAGGESYLDLLLLRDPHDPDLGRSTMLGVIARVPHALAVQLTHIAEFATGGYWLLATWLSPLTVALAALLCIGLVQSLRRANPVLGWYCLAYGAIMLTWPFDEGVRFVLPVFPIALLLLGHGWAWSAKRLGAPAPDAPPAPGVVSPRVRRLPLLALGFVAIAFLVVILFVARAFPSHSRQGSAIVVSWICILGLLAWSWLKAPALHLIRWRKRLRWSLLTVYATANLTQTVPVAIGHVQGRDTGAMTLRPAVEWLRRHAAPSDIVMSQFASGVYLHTGLRSAYLPITRNRVRLLDELRRVQPRFLVIIDTPASPYYFPTEVERLAIIREALGAEHLSLAFRSGVGAVYRIR